MKRPSFLPFFPPYETVKPAGFFSDGGFTIPPPRPARETNHKKKQTKLMTFLRFFLFFFFFPFVQTLTVHSPFQPIIRIIIIGRDRDLSTVGGGFTEPEGGGEFRKEREKKEIK
jgi:hypothetical protein